MIPLQGRALRRVPSPKNGYEVSMSFDEYERYDALGLAEKVRQGEVSPEELLEAALERCADRPAYRVWS